MNPITVTRKHKYEMDQAINDLLCRGYRLIYGPTEKTAITTQRGNYSYRKGKYHSIERGVASCWIAKLTKESVTLTKLS